MRSRFIDCALSLLIPCPFREATTDDVQEWEHLLRNPAEVELKTDEIYKRLFYRDGVLQMQLSNAFNPNLLLVGTTNGLVHAFVYLRTRMGGELVFQCSKCLYENSKLPGEKAEVVLLDGRIGYEKSNHHCCCRPYSKPEMIRIQLERRIRLITKVCSS